MTNSARCLQLLLIWLDVHACCLSAFSSPLITESLWLITPSGRSKSVFTDQNLQTPANLKMFITHPALWAYTEFVFNELLFFLMAPVCFEVPGLTVQKHYVTTGTRTQLYNFVPGISNLYPGGQKKETGHNWIQLKYNRISVACMLQFTDKVTWQRQR